MDHSKTNNYQDNNQNHSWIASDFLKDCKNFDALKEYRQSMFNHLGDRCDAAMDLIDALSSNRNAKSVTELSMSPCFKRKYSSVSDSIQYASSELLEIKREIKDWGIKSLSEISFLEGSAAAVIVDSTPSPHPYAQCLADRTNIHDSSNKVTGRPINIGHSYSSVVGITPHNEWVVPILHDRIPSIEKPATFGITQIMEIAENRPDKHTIALMDSGYNNASCRLKAIELTTKNDNKITPPTIIVRSSCNRNYYLETAQLEGPKGRGRPKKYGEKINIKSPEDGAKADHIFKISPNSKIGSLVVYCWQKVHTKQQGMKNANDPSSLMVIFEYKEDGSLKYKNPMVLRVFISLLFKFNQWNAGWLYIFRFMIERYFFMLKQNLLFGKFHSPKIEHQETFAIMSIIAYQQLYIARESGAVTETLMPWHRYPKSNPKGLVLSPSNIQRSFGNVIKEVGTPSKYRLPKCIPAGRPLGSKMAKKVKCPVINKKQDVSNKKVKPQGTSEADPSSQLVEVSSMNTKTRIVALDVLANAIKKNEEVTNDNLNNDKKSFVSNVLHVGIVLIFVMLTGFFKNNNATPYIQKYYSTYSLQSVIKDEKQLSRISPPIELVALISSGDLIRCTPISLDKLLESLDIRGPPNQMV